MTRRTALPLLHLIAGFAIWGLAFNLLYGLHALGCEAGWAEVRLGPTDLLRVALASCYLAHLLAFAALLFHQRHPAQRDAEISTGALHRIGFWLTGAAALASAAILLPAIVLETCATGPLA